MELIKAIIMGIVQGICEFLPVSSSGHLAIFKQILNINTDTGLLFDIMLHVGTLAAIFVAYKEDVFKLIAEGFTIVGLFFKNFFMFIVNIFSKKGKKYQSIITTPYRRFVMLVIVSTIPTGIIGIVLKDFIEYSSTTLIIPGIMLLLTGIELIIADKITIKNITEENATYKSATAIGVAQGLATMPGLSRSGTTITACLYCGFTKEFAVKYSFIMSIPAILGSMVLELKDFSDISIVKSELYCYAVGMIVAGIVGYICILTMLKIVRKKSFLFFSIYCFIVGSVAIIANFII